MKFRTLKKDLLKTQLKLFSKCTKTRLVRASYREIYSIMRVFMTNQCLKYLKLWQKKWTTWIVILTLSSGKNLAIVIYIIIVESTISSKNLKIQITLVANSPPLFNAPLNMPNLCNAQFVKGTLARRLEIDTFLSVKIS